MPTGVPAPEPYEFHGVLRECTICGRHQPMEKPHWDPMNDGRRIPWDAWCRKCNKENKVKNKKKAA